MRAIRSRLLVALGLIVGLVAAPTAAIATEPVSLGSGYVHDEAGVLSAGELETADARLADLRESSDAEMWVVLVDEFTNPSDSAEWANAAADLNGLGNDQYLLAISTETRQLFLSPPVDGGLSESKLIAIEEATGAALSDDDWAAGIAAAADEFAEQSKPNYTIIFVIIGLVVAVALAIAIAALVARAKKRRAEREAREKLEAEVAQLEQRASVLLVEMDDDLRTAEQELGFATAQFGGEAVADYEKALAGARAALDQSFRIQGSLEGAESAPLEKRREAYGEMIRLIEQADAELDAKAEEFDRLRELEQNAPQVLASLDERRAALADAPARIATEIARLRETYASPALDDVADNDEQAEARLAFAATALDEAREAVADGATGEAASDLHDAERALGQVDELLAAVTSLAPAFADAEKRALETIAELEGDIRQAQQMPDPDGRIARAIAETTARIDEARANLTGSERTPIIVADALEQADKAIDDVVATARAAEEARRRKAQKLDGAIRQAHHHLGTAESYISTRRGGIGGTARSQAAQARAALDDAAALAQTDPDRAIARAQEASRLAQRASQSARNDVNRYRGSGYGGHSSGYGRRRSSGIGDDIVGGLIGGLIGGSISGGSQRRGSGWGSSSRGGLGGGFGGGSSRSSRGRSGGISRSSGGRRGGGRRF